MPPIRRNPTPTDASLAATTEISTPATAETRTNAATNSNQTQSTAGPVSHNRESVGAVQVPQQPSAHPNPTNSTDEGSNDAVTAARVEGAIPSVSAPAIRAIDTLDPATPALYKAYAESVLAQAQAFSRLAEELSNEASVYADNARRFHDRELHFTLRILRSSSTPPAWPARADQMRQFSMDRGGACYRTWVIGAQLLRIAENCSALGINTHDVIYLEGFERFESATRILKVGLAMCQFSNEHYEGVIEMFEVAYRRYRLRYRLGRQSEV